MKFIVLIKKRLPILTILLALSCLFSTLPQVFLPSLYSEITGQYAAGGSLFLLTLPVFTHSPGILINHLVGNLLVILVFGGFTEIILGTSRFALVSLITFGLTTMVNVFHFSGGGEAHGASGICFGYIMFFLFFVVIIFENRKYSLFKNPLIIFSLFLAVFSMIGLPVIEVLVLRMRFFENFGQTSHLVSYFAATPFILVWRKDIEENCRRLIFKESFSGREQKKSVSFYLWILIVSVNILATVFTANLVLRFSEDDFVYTVKPSPEELITTIDKEIVVVFNKDMVLDSDRLKEKSITYSTQDVPGIHTEWAGPRRLIIVFSRPFLNTESIHLTYEVRREIAKGLEKTESIELKYDYHLEVSE